MSASKPALLLRCLPTSVLVCVLFAAFAVLPPNAHSETLPASTAQVSADAANAQTLHLVVGHLVFLTTHTRVKRIYISNPKVLDSYTVSPMQIVINAVQPGISSVVVWDTADRQQTYTVSSDVNVDDLRAAMHHAFADEDIHVDSGEGRVLLSGTVTTDAASDSAAKLCGLFSKDVVNSIVVNSARIKQVKLKVRIVEVDRSKLAQFGINIFSPGGGSTIASSSTAQFPSTATLTTDNSGSGSSVGGNTLSVSDPLNFLLYNSKINVGVSIRDLENKQILQILAEPTITSLSGQKAAFLAGGEFPFPVVQGSTGGLTSVTIQFRPYGVKLDFTPTVNADGSIQLKVAPEVSALDYTNAVTISGYTIPALSTRRAETQVVLHSGQSFAISGLLDKRTTDQYSKTPGISKIPILGALFKSKGVNLSTTELIIIVTPEIVDPLASSGESPVPLAEPQPVRPFLDSPTFDSKLPSSTRNQ